MSITRIKNIFNPDSKSPFELSRTKVELFVKCPRCFYLDRRLGVSQPSWPSFTLNLAVDNLLKKEFDIHRAKNTAHPLMEKYGIDAVPFSHEKMDEWRDNFKGIRVFHKPTNLIIFGAIDDIWVGKSRELAIVDYKATSTDQAINLDDKWKDAYKRQMEIYQWLARHNEDLKNYQISDLGYFVYCNGKKDREAFDKKLEFDVEIIPYKGNDSWVEQIIIDAHKCLMGNEIPMAADDCEFCQYVRAISEREKR